MNITKIYQNAFSGLALVYMVPASLALAFGLKLWLKWPFWKAAAVAVAALPPGLYLLQKIRQGRVT